MIRGGNVSTIDINQPTLPEDLVTDWQYELGCVGCYISQLHSGCYFACHQLGIFLQHS